MTRDRYLFAAITVRYVCRDNSIPNPFVSLLKICQDSYYPKPFCVIAKIVVAKKSFPIIPNLFVWSFAMTHDRYYP